MYWVRRILLVEGSFILCCVNDWFCVSLDVKTVSNSTKIMRFRQDRIIRNNMLGVNNVFTLTLYNRNWLLDVVTVNPLNKKDDILSSQRFRLCRRMCCMYIYLYIDVAMCLMALVELPKIALIIIEKCKRH